METTVNTLSDSTACNRRSFVETGLEMAAAAGIAGVGLFAGCKEKEKANEGEGQEVSPPEDLMQEHGLLNRVLLSYDTCRHHLVNKQKFPVETLSTAAGVIRTFVED